MSESQVDLISAILRETKILRNRSRGHVSVVEVVPGDILDGVNSEEPPYKSLDSSLGSVYLREPQPEDGGICTENISGVNQWSLSRKEDPQDRIYLIVYTPYEGTVMINLAGFRPEKFDPDDFNEYIVPEGILKLDDTIIKGHGIATLDDGEEGAARLIHGLICASVERGLHDQSIPIDSYSHIDYSQVEWRLLRT